MSNILDRLYEILIDLNISLAFKKDSINFEPLKTYLELPLVIKKLGETNKNKLLNEIIPKIEDIYQLRLHLMNESEYNSLNEKHAELKREYEKLTKASEVKERPTEGPTDPKVTELEGGKKKKSKKHRKNRNRKTKKYRK